MARGAVGPMCEQFIRPMKYLHDRQVVQGKMVRTRGERLAHIIALRSRGRPARPMIDDLINLIRESTGLYHRTRCEGSLSTVRPGGNEPIMALRRIE